MYFSWRIVQKFIQELNICEGAWLIKVQRKHTYNYEIIIGGRASRSYFCQITSYVKLTLKHNSFKAVVPSHSLRELKLQPQAHTMLVSKYLRWLPQEAYLQVTHQQVISQKVQDCRLLCNYSKLVLAAEATTLKLIHLDIHEITMGFQKNSINDSLLSLNCLELAKAGRKAEATVTAWRNLKGICARKGKIWSLGLWWKTLLQYLFPLTFYFQCQRTCKLFWGGKILAFFKLHFHFNDFIKKEVSRVVLRCHTNISAALSCFILQQFTQFDLQSCFPLRK